MSEVRNSAEVHVFEASTPVYPQPLFPDDRYSQGTPHGWRPTRSGIYTRHMITIETFRTHRHSRPTIVDDPDILVIRRGYRVRLHGDRNAQTWEIWRSINVARLHALDYQSTQPLVFTGNSALLLHGIPTWSMNSCVEAWPSQSSFHVRPYPAVHHRRTVVPGTPVISRKIPPHSIVQIDGLATESPIEAVVRLALNDQPRDAFVATCMTMHALSEFDRFNVEDSRRQSERVRLEMLKELDRHAQHASYQRAHTIIEAADGGCDNIFEATVLWIVKSLYSGNVVTQLPIPTDDHIYFGDIALPDLKIIIEPDGRTKFGDSEQEVRENTGKWLTRQHDLTNAGWRVIRVRWHDTDDLIAFRANVATRLGIHHLPVAQDSLRLWAVPRPPSEARIHGPHKH